MELRARIRHFARPAAFTVALTALLVPAVAGPATADAAKRKKKRYPVVTSVRPMNAKVGDTIDGVPVVDGAFVDPSAAEVPGADSAAERAARMSRPAPTRPAEPTVHRRRFRLRAWIIALAVLAVVIAALGGTYAWTQTQYFVGRAGDDVAIFQGVNADFGPLKFYDVYKVTDIPVSHLNPNVRPQVNDGITANSLKDAENIVENLREKQTDACLRLTSPPPSPTPSPTPSQTRTASESRPPSQTHNSASSSPKNRDRSTGSAHRTGETSHSSQTRSASTSSTATVTPSPTQTCPP